MSSIQTILQRGVAGQDAVVDVLREKALVYGLWVSQANGLRAYVVLEINRQNHTEFKQRMADKSIVDLSAFGRILYTGWQRPPAELRAEFGRKYGMYEDAA